MHTRLFALIAVAAPLALFTGCQSTVDVDSDFEDDLPGPITRTVGSQGNNGLDWGNYHALESAFRESMNYALWKDGSYNVSERVENFLLGAPEGVDVLSHAVACAVPRGSYVRWNNEVYWGRGHIHGADAWLYGGLSETVQDDVISCMSAHMNANSGIRILLTGRHVNLNESEKENADYRVEEALWYTRRNGDGTPIHYAVPLSPITQKCAASAWSAIAHRYCGQHLLECDLHLGSGCTPDDDSGDRYTCAGGVSAIRTVLDSDQFNRDYDPCPPAIPASPVSD